MKKLFVLLAAVLITATLTAQTPEKMSYQAVIRNNSNQLVTNQQVGMRVSILFGSATGTPSYIERQTPTTNENGLVSIEIGDGIFVSGRLDTISWGAGTYFIKTEIDVTGGQIYTITGTSQLLSVAYALHAKNGYTHNVGELYQGGIIVSVWKENGSEHGLIASLTNLSSGCDWYTAVSLCNSYSSGNFTDWYLPGLWELNLCYNAALSINRILGAADGFTLNMYWASYVEPGYEDQAMCWSFREGFAGGGYKTDIRKVRAVRTF